MGKFEWFFFVRFCRGVRFWPSLRLFDTGCCEEKMVIDWEWDGKFSCKEPFGNPKNLCGHLKNLCGHSKNQCGHLKNQCGHLKNLFGRPKNLFGLFHKINRLHNWISTEKEEISGTLRLNRTTSIRTLSRFQSWVKTVISFCRVHVASNSRLGYLLCAYGTWSTKVKEHPQNTFILLTSQFSNTLFWGKHFLATTFLSTHSHKGIKEEEPVTLSPRGGVYHSATK